MKPRARALSPGGRASCFALAVFALPACTRRELAGAPQPRIQAIAATPTSSAVADPLRASQEPTLDAPASARGEVTLELAEARFASLALAPGREGREAVFDAKLEAPTPASQREVREPNRRSAIERAELRVARQEAPFAHKTKLAFYRLAEALGARVVPPCATRAVPLAELLALLDGDKAGARVVRRDAIIGNDGTVATLVVASTPSGVPIDPERSAEAARFARWAASERPTPDESPELLRDYVEMLSLDYLSATSLRRSALLTTDPPGLVLRDSEYAFPVHPSNLAMDGLLHRLKAVRRFPSELRTGLSELDAESARLRFNGGPFETWLLSPRELLELEERRAALVSLIDARVETEGAAAIF